MRTAERRRSKTLRVTMVLENESYPEDIRVRNEATALAIAGHEVTVLAPRRNGQTARETIQGVDVVRYRRPTARGGARGYLVEYAIAHLQLLPRVLAQLARGADVVHLHNPPDTLVIFGLLGRAVGRRLVYDHHDLAPELFELKFGRSRVVRILRWLQRLSFRASDIVVVTNESQLAVAVAAGVRPDKVTVVRNGPLETAIVRAPALRDGELEDARLVYVGSLESQDGVDLLPEIIECLRQRPGRSFARLTVVGDGGALEELRRAVQGRGLAPVVRFTGRVPGETVPELLAEADICIDPAPCNPLNHRSTMIKIGEYLAAGRPVVAYALEETRRTAADGALYARCGDIDHFVELLDLLAGDAELRHEVAARGHTRASELTWERSADALRRAYERMCPTTT
jgi:glycosyltransferase involved in cell wall biosynthesis